MINSWTIIYIQGSREYLQYFLSYALDGVIGDGRTNAWTGGPITMHALSVGEKHNILKHYLHRYKLEHKYQNTIHTVNTRLVKINNL